MWQRSEVGWRHGDSRMASWSSVNLVFKLGVVGPGLKTEGRES